MPEQYDEKFLQEASDAYDAEMEALYAQDEYLDDVAREEARQACLSAEGEAILERLVFDTASEMAYNVNQSGYDEQFNFLRERGWTLRAAGLSLLVEEAAQNMALELLEGGTFEDKVNFLIEEFWTIQQIRDRVVSVLPNKEQA